MAYLGLVPSEYSSGNRHARRILVESAWTYRFNPRVSRCLIAVARELAGFVWDIAPHVKVTARTARSAPHFIQRPSTESATRCAAPMRGTLDAF